MLTFQSNEAVLVANTIAQCRICRRICPLLALKLAAVKGWNHTVDCCCRFKESFGITITYVTFFSHLLKNLNWENVELAGKQEKYFFFEHQLHSCQLAPTWANDEITSHLRSQGANLRVLSANKWHMFCRRCQTWQTTDWDTQDWLAASGQLYSVQRP